MELKYMKKETESDEKISRHCSLAHTVAAYNVAHGFKAPKMCGFVEDCKNPKDDPECDEKVLRKLIKKTLSG